MGTEPRKAGGSSWAAALGILGGIMMLIGGGLIFGTMATINSLLNEYGLTWGDIGVDPNALSASAGLTLLWGFFALIGGAAAYYKESASAGTLILMLAGFIAVIGMFVPVDTVEVGYYSLPLTLSSSLIYIDPFLVLIGGFVGWYTNTIGGIQAPIVRQPTVEFQPQTHFEQEAHSNAENSINDQLKLLQDEVKRLKADLEIYRTAIAAKDATIVEQAKEIEQLKDFIAKVSERVTHPQKNFRSEKND